MSLKYLKITSRHKKIVEVMMEPDNHSISNILDDLNAALEEEQNEQLTELEFEELMEALDTPGL